MITNHQDYISSSKLNIDISVFGFNEIQKLELNDFIETKKKIFSSAVGELSESKLEELLGILLKEVHNKAHELIQQNSNREIKLHTFSESSIMGKLGVLILADFLLSNNICHRVENLDNNLEQQFQGYDIILHLNLNNPVGQKWYKKFNKSSINVEVKTDAQNLTGNIALELFSNFQTKRLGWSLTSKSDLVFYFFINSHQLFIFDTKLLNGMTTHFHSLFNPLYEFYKNSPDTEVGDLTSFEIIVYPKKCDTPFELTPFGRKSLEKGGKFSGLSRYNKIKNKRYYGILDADFFFSSFRDKEDILRKHYNLSDTFKTFKTFSFAYIQAVNGGSKKNPFFSLCLLFPIKLVEVLNFSQNMYIPRNPNLNLKIGFTFSKGGAIERKRTDPNSNKTITDKISFTESSYKKVVEKFIETEAKFKYPPDIIKETFY